MRLFLIVIALFALFVTKEPTTGNVILSLDETVSVHFPEDFNMDGLEINYKITGSFGGYASFVRVEPNVRNYQIPIVSEDGKPAKTLKLIVFSPHYRVKVFDFPSLENRKEKIEIKPERSKAVRFSGKVLLPDDLNVEQVRLRVIYTADWECIFYHLQECMLAGIPITSVNLDKDGTFKVDLPDFAGDEVINSFGETGAFSFDLPHQNSGNVRAWLKPKDDPKNLGRIQAAASYPNETVFILRTEK